MSMCWTRTASGQSKSAGSYLSLLSFGFSFYQHLPSSSTRPDCFVGIYISKEFGRRFWQYGINEHSRTEFEARGTGKARNHAYIPMEMAGAGIVGRAAANREIKIRILQPNVKLGQQAPQDTSKVRNL